MKTELHNYDIYPKVILAGKEVEITIKPLGKHVEFKSEENFITLHPFNEGTVWDYQERNNQIDYTVVPCEDGCLRFRHSFEGEQQYYVRVFEEEGGKRLAQLSVYSVFEDLAGRYPLMGDLHIHTFRSDGKEDPAIVAANYRRVGYDFFAITDHRRYYPSLDAIEAFADVETGFTIVPGEEVHMPKGAWPHVNDVHIVNFGSEYSVNALVEGDHIKEVGSSLERRSLSGECPPVISKEEFFKEVDALAETLNIPQGIERFAFACCKWVFDHIKKGNGLGIFCHPYWISNVLQVPETLTDYIMAAQPFDAFEVLGGERNFEQNGYQTVRYYEDLAKGRKYPIVGSSDSHGSINNQNAYVGATIVFAPENERTSIISSIKNFYSVAVDNISNEFRLVGESRLVRYGCFLLQEYFPLHDELCFEEGRLMKAFICGEEGAKDALKFIGGRVQRQREKYFSF